MKFHETLKLKRRTKKLTQRQLAKMVNITCASLSNYEKCIYVPSLTVALKLSKVLGFSLDKLEIERNVRVPIVGRIGKLRAGKSNELFSD